MFTNWGKSNNCGTQLKFGLNRSSTSNGWPEYGRVEQVPFDGVDNEVTTMMMTMINFVRVTRSKHVLVVVTSGMLVRSQMLEVTEPSMYFTRMETLNDV